jgi:hypothetical protein
VAIDLKNVLLVDREAVRLLAVRESNGDELETTPPRFVNGSREKGRHKCAANNEYEEGTILMLDASEALGRNSDPGGAGIERNHNESRCNGI